MSEQLARHTEHEPSEGDVGTRQNVCNNFSPKYIIGNVSFVAF